MTIQSDDDTPVSIKAALARVAVHDIVNGGAIALDLSFKTGRQSVIVTRKGDTLSAFINRCPHARWPLDTFDGRFLFTPDGHLMCAAHSAVFDPVTGVCLGGPGVGAGLTPVATRAVEGGLEVLDASLSQTKKGGPEGPP